MSGKTLTVQNVPSEVIDKLSGRAAASGRSLEDYVRLHLLEWAARPDPEAWAARVRDRKRTIGGVSVADLLRDRDAERR